MTYMKQLMSNTHRESRRKEFCVTLNHIFSRIIETHQTLSVAPLSSTLASREISQVESKEEDEEKNKKKEKKKMQLREAWREFAAFGEQYRQFISVYQGRTFLHIFLFLFSFSYFFLLLLV